jgi:hypothetical protein
VGVLKVRREAKLYMARHSELHVYILLGPQEGDPVSVKTFFVLIEDCKPSELADLVHSLSEIDPQAGFNRCNFLTV